MVDESITVELEFNNESLRDTFEAVILAQEEFRLRTSEDTEPPHLIILEMDEDRDKTFALIHSILSSSPATGIFLTLPHTDTDVLLQALRTGVKEIIPQPVQKAELEQALARWKERYRQSKPQQAKKGTIVNILGSKGGVGTTTIAVNLAIQLREREANAKKSVVLVDLNPQFGDAALFLDIKPTHTFGDVTKSLDRLDMTFLMSVLSSHPSGLYLLPSVNDIEEIDLLTPQSVLRTLELLQESFDYVVLDSGHSLNDMTISALHVAPTLMLVSTLVLSVMRNTKRFLDILSNLGLAREDIKIIVNRYKSKNKDINLKDFEEALQKKPFWLIPNDYLTTLSAINTGNPVLYSSKRGKITRNIKKLTDTIVKEKSNNKSSLFTRSFR